MDNLVIGVVVVLVIFLICRELVCWYWKINEIAARLKKQEEYQQALLDGLRSVNGNVIRIAVLLTPNTAPPPEA